MFLPYAADTPMQRIPYANFAMIAVNILVYLYMLTMSEGQLTKFLLEYGLGESELEILYVLHNVDNSVLGWITYMFIHAGFIHLLGNMIFLWVFGNVVCSKLGTVRYLLAYLGWGLAAAILHTLTGGGLVVGASGAINGVVGMYFILFPFNQVSLLMILFVITRVIRCSGFWIIGMWFVFDIWGALGGTGSGVAYFAHVGGFLAGAATGTAVLYFGWVKMVYGEMSLLHHFGWLPPLTRDRNPPPNKDKSLFRR